MATTAVPARVEDHRVFLHGASWNDYERILGIRGEAPTPRLAFLKGVLELMSPSWKHEAIAEMIGLLLVEYAKERDVALHSYGSWTLKKPVQERGAEADKCYMIARVPADEDDVPDFAVEVVWTSGGLDKLDIYRGLKVPEVWFWEDGAITVHVLSESGDRYDPVPKSPSLPGVDLATIARLATREDQIQALGEFREALRVQ